MTPSPLPREFYDRSAAVVAPELLGHWLLRRTEAGWTGGRIVETEAYLAAGDPACHAAKGRTARNASMWGPPGRAYVYFIYGVHHCFNAVCCAEGVAEAVLVRAIELDIGANASGPGRICAVLGIDRALDGTDLCSAESPVIIARNPDAAAFLAERAPLRIGPRIGISRAVDLPLRFHLEGSRAVSGRRWKAGPWPPR